MCVYIYIYIYLYIHCHYYYTCVYIPLSLSIYIYTHIITYNSVRNITYDGAPVAAGRSQHLAELYMCMYVCMYMCICIYVYIHICVSLSLSLYVYVYITHNCTCVYIYIYNNIYIIYIYIYTYPNNIKQTKQLHISQEILGFRKKSLHLKENPCIIYMRNLLGWLETKLAQHISTYV